MSKPETHYENWVQVMRRAIHDGNFPIPDFEKNPREALEFFRQAALDRRDEVKFDVIEHVSSYLFAEPVIMGVMIDALVGLRDRRLSDQACQIIIIEWQCEPDRDYRGYPLLVLDLLRSKRHYLHRIVNDDGQTLGEFLVTPAVFRQVFEVLVSGEDFGKKVLHAAAEQLTESSDIESPEHLNIIRQLLENHKDPKVRAIFENHYAWLATRDPLGDFLAQTGAKLKARGLSEKEIKVELTRATKAYKAMFGAYDVIKRDLDSQNDLPEDDDEE